MSSRLRVFFIVVMCSLASVSSSEEVCRNPVISGPPIFPPYIVPIDERTSGGIAVDRAIDLLTPVVGKPVIDETKPWARVLQDFEQGVIDILFVVLYDPERESYAKYTSPWISDDYGVVTNADYDFNYEAISSLNNLKGGHYYGARLPEPFGRYIKDNPQVEGIQQVDSMYKMLQLERVNYLIVAIESFRLLKPEGFNSEDFIVHEASITSIPVYMAVSKKSPCIEMFDVINQAVSP